MREQLALYPDAGGAACHWVGALLVPGRAYDVMHDYVGNTTLLLGLMWG